MYSYVGSYGIAITKLQWWKVIKYKVNISSTVFVLHLNVYFSDDVLPLENFYVYFLFIIFLK